VNAKLMVSACCLPRRGSRRKPVTPVPAPTPANPASGVIDGPYKLARWTSAAVNVVDIDCDLARLARGSQHAQDEAQPTQSVSISVVAIGSGPSSSLTTSSSLKLMRTRGLRVAQQGGGADVP